MSLSIAHLNTDLAQVASGVQRSLVHISTGRGAGAGTIWHADGLIVTNAHVIAGHRPLNITLQDGRTLPAQVLAVDKDRDLAALSIEANGLPTVALGDSRALRTGQWVMALGHPWGVANALTAGTVIGTGSQWPEMPLNGREWVVVGMRLRPGHSGGPLVDVEGRVVGINTMITGPEVGVVIPTHTVKAFLKETLGTQQRAS